MTTLYVLLAFGLCVAAGFVAVVIDDLRWEARNRLPRCTTCGQPHHRHAAHR